jgi:hypothetical protein
MTGHDYTAFETPLAHPGEHLREDYLPDYKLTAGALAKLMGLKDPYTHRALDPRKAAGDAGHGPATRQGVRHDR